MSRSLLLGLDGATFDVLDRYMDAGLMPNLKKLCARGTRANLLSTPNPLTPSAWTSMTTSRSPGHHGIFDFVRAEQFSYHPHFRLATSSDIRTQTIWNMLAQQDKTYISLNFPVMFPAQKEKGFMIPGFVPTRHLRRAVNPGNLYDRLKKLPDLDVDEIAVDFEEERRSVQVMDKNDLEDWLRFHIRREKHWYVILRHLMETEPWDLAGVVFDGVDKLQHIAWRFIDDRLYDASKASAWERKVRELCLDYFKQIDDFVAGLTELMNDDDAVYVTSDHGFGPSDEIFYVNSWLSRQGHLTWLDDAPLAKEGMLNTEGMKSPSFLFEWPKTRAYALTPGSNGIYLFMDGQQGDVPKMERDALIGSLTEALLKVTNPATGERVVQRVMPREEVFPGEQSHLAPDLTLVLRDYGFVSVLRSDDDVKSRPEIVGAHRPEGIFVAAGKGIRKSESVADLGIMDVTPALMYSMDQPIPDDFEGRLPDEVYEKSHLASNPPQTVKKAEWKPPEEDEVAESGMDAEGEEKVMERLKALGYIE